MFCRGLLTLPGECYEEYDRAHDPVAVESQETADRAERDVEDEGHDAAI